MPEAGFHFEQPAWFWGLLALIPVAIWLWRSAAKAARGPIHRYADPHLLPHLTGTRELKATASRLNEQKYKWVTVEVVRTFGVLNDKRALPFLLWMSGTTKTAQQK